MISNQWPTTQSIPAWVFFLYEHPTLITDEPEKFTPSLEQINDNIYDRRPLSEFVASLKLEGFDFECLVTRDGSLSVPMIQSIATREQAITQFNHIVASLFLGGYLVRPLDVIRLEQGSIRADGSGNDIHNVSEGNLFRLGGKSKAERIKWINPVCHTPVEFVAVYTVGHEIIKATNFESLFLLNGYDYLVCQKSADALSNLWIVVEQLTEVIFQSKIDETSRRALSIANGKMNIAAKHKVLLHYQVINNSIHSTLAKCRQIRNDMLHKGVSPSLNLSIELWPVLLNLFEIAYQKQLTNLQESAQNLLEHVAADRCINYQQEPNTQNWLHIQTQLAQNYQERTFK